MTSTDLTSFCDSYNDSNKFLTAPNDLKNSSMVWLELAAE